LFSIRSNSKLKLELQTIRRVKAVSAALVVMVALAGASAWASDAKDDQAPSTPKARPVIVATVQPLAMILRELAGDRAQVLTLLPAGASPHAFSPRPSEARACERAARVFMVAPTLDAWAARLAPASKTVSVFEMIPPANRRYFAPGDDDALPAGGGGKATDGRVPDPHFWTDPLTVKAMLPALAARLAADDPAGAAAYRANAAAFAKRLDGLQAEMAALLAPAKGRSAGFFHPSFRYLLARYGLREAGVVEFAPGKEPSPRELLELTKKLKSNGARALFCEPQLPRRPAELLAQASGLPLGEMDEMGGQPGRDDYAALLRYNVQTLAKALK
jgi:zinc transport system substrate-binding protein